MIGEPRLRVKRHAPGEQHAASLGELDPFIEDPASGEVAQPEPSPLERIRRQVDDPAAAERRAPVHRDAVHMRLRQAGEEPLDTAVITAQCAEHDRVGSG